MGGSGVVVSHVLTAGVIEARFQIQPFGSNLPRGFSVIEGALTIVHRCFKIQGERRQIQLATVKGQPEYLLALFKLEGQRTDGLEAGEAAGVRQVLHLGRSIEATSLLEGRGDGLAIGGRGR